MERLRARLPPPMPEWMHRPLRVVPIIVVLNVVVFAAWRASVLAPGLQTFMGNNFLVSWTHLEHGYWWTLLTAAFSHFEWWHIGINMVVLWSFGSVLERLMGPRLFATFYLTSAVVSSAIHCGVSRLMGKPDMAALGASGAVSALLLAYALLFPKARLLVFGIVPVPALTGALFFVALDIWGLVAQGRGGGLPIGHGAHLGGALCGLIFWYALFRYRLSPAGHRRAPAPGGLGLDPEEARRFDALRLKLTREGPQSLTPEERAFLEKVRNRALR